MVTSAKGYPSLMPLKSQSGRRRGGEKRVLSKALFMELGTPTSLRWGPEAGGRGCLPATAPR